MKIVMVRYTVKSDESENNVRYIRAVFDELARKSPPDIKYATFVLDDGVSFVHIASIETEDGSNPLEGLSAFKEFISELKHRCEKPPVATPLKEIGSYNFFS